MSIKAEPIGSYCLIEATLEGFSSEQLAYELAKRHGRAAPAELAKGMVQQERFAAHAKIAELVQQEIPSDVATLVEEVHLRDFDTRSLLDQVEAQPDFKALLKAQLGLTVLDAGDRDVIGRAIARGEFQGLYAALMARVDPSTRYIWASRRGERAVNSPVAHQQQPETPIRPPSDKPTSDLWKEVTL